LFLAVGNAPFAKFLRQLKLEARDKRFGTCVKQRGKQFETDGHNLFRDEDATYGKSWGLADYLDKTGRDLIIVGLECNHEGNKRLEEFCPYTFRDFDRKKIHGTGKILVEWMADELKPLIDRELPTLPDREHTAVGGSSMGGLMAYYSVVARNDIFSKAACLSPALGFCSSLYWRDLNEAAVSPDTRVYFSWGTREGGKNEHPDEEDRSSWTYRMLSITGEKFESRGAAVMRYCQVGGRHCEADWEKQLPLFMPFLWQG
jgi:predicted alpha/beta superfamily hydrolase